ncbi:hypothetical protein BVI061214_00476 [Thermus aquaticus]|jgi:hypothetical protein|uniref:Uncharacterized protein n=1 Tax=Thermus aquaticus TaxID=271 RepID=A0A0M9ADQ3_THEAQ|nr:hypothetical protein [Thermus aquaticus]KOX89318.1 hypothetical protein BVI061214_00476 [Thermus aquaticus]
MMGIRRLLTALLVALAALALAHESRQVGPYRIVIGFLYNPAFAGFPNSLDLRVTEGDKPVEGLEKTLIVEIIAPNGEAFQVDLRRAHGQPGYYRGWFIPGVSGNYVWRVRGRIGDLEVNETFSKFFHSKEAVLDPREYTVPKGR